MVLWSKSCLKNITSLAYCLLNNFSAQYCSKDPPAAPEEGKAIVRNTGLMYGHNCSSATFWPLSDDGGCNNLEIKRKTKFGSVATYELLVRPSPPQERFVAYISFSQPVDLRSLGSLTQVFIIIVVQFHYTHHIFSACWILISLNRHREKCSLFCRM
jgi:hypothetical protein